MSFSLLTSIQEKTTWHSPKSILFLRSTNLLFTFPTHFAQQTKVAMSSIDRSEDNSKTDDDPYDRMLTYLTGKRKEERKAKEKAIRFPIKVRYLGRAEKLFVLNAFTTTLPLQLPNKFHLSIISHTFTINISAIVDVYYSMW